MEDLSEKQQLKIEARDLKSLLKKSYADLQRNSLNMNKLLRAVEDSNEEAMKRYEKLKNEQLFLARTIFKVEERLGDLGEGLDLKWPLNRYAEKQRKWIETVGRPQ